jgi:anti-repressor protein
VSTMVLQESGLEFRSDEGEPRIRDLDLAERLGYERRRDIRKIIERFVNEIGICATVAQNHGRG